MKETPGQEDKLSLGEGGRVSFIQERFIFSLYHQDNSQHITDFR